MSDTLYSAADIVGKTLIANSNVNVLDASGNILRVVSAGNPIGIVYSWIQQPNGDLWWMFYDDYDQPYYVKHRTGLFNIAVLTQQGTLTTQQKLILEAEANKPWYEKLFDSATGGVSTLLVAGIAIWGAVEIYKASKKK